MLLRLVASPHGERTLVQRPTGAEHRDQHDEQRRRDGRCVSLGHVHADVCERASARGHRLAVAESVEILREFQRRGVAVARIVGEAVRHDRVQVAFHAVTQRRHGLVALLRNLSLRGGIERIEGRQHTAAAVAEIAAHGESAQHGAEGVDVAANIGAVHAHAQQFRRQIVGGADDRAGLLVGIGWLEGGVGHAEVDHLHVGLVGLEREQDVRGLQVAVHQPVFVRMMDASRHIGHQAHAVVHRQSRGIAGFGDGRALCQFHGEPWSAVVGFARFEHLHQRGVAEQRKQAALGLEA